jgi:hypothetical protein
MASPLPQTLKLLLDEHVSPDVATALCHRQKDAVIICLAEWEGGRFMGQPDELLLREAAVQKLTLVTYDRKTIPPLLKIWAEAGRVHGGVLFVDEKTIPPPDFGGLARALQKVLLEAAGWDWTNRICFLRR